jgi:hypothetical protein
MAQVAPPRLRGVYIPMPPPGGTHFGWVHVAACVGICLLIGASLPLWVRWNHWPIRKDTLLRGEVLGLAIATALFSVLIVGPSWSRGRLWLARRRVRARWRGRRARLAKLRPESLACLPHRRVEAELLSALLRRRLFFPRNAMPRRAVQRVFRDEWPATTVIGPDRPFHGALLPAVISWPFEPIDGLDPRDYQQLIDWDIEARGRQFNWAKTVEKARDLTALRKRVRKSQLPRSENLPGSHARTKWLLWREAKNVLLLGALGALGGAFGLRYVQGWLIIFLIFAVLVMIPLLFRRFYFRPQTWLVPGGIVTATHPLIRKRGRAIYASRERTRIVVDLVNAYAYVCMGDTVRRIPFFWPYLIAWMASAPSPSIEAVQALVGEDVELTVAE